WTLGSRMPVLTAMVGHLQKKPVQISGRAFSFLLLCLLLTAGRNTAFAGIRKQSQASYNHGQGQPLSHRQAGAEQTQIAVGLAGVLHHEAEETIADQEQGTGLTHSAWTARKPP